jgi:hypothetical protein
MTNKLTDTVSSMKQDGVVWMAQHLIGEAGDDAYLKSEAIQQVAIAVNQIPSLTVRQDYKSQLMKQFKIKSKEYDEALKSGMSKNIRKDKTGPSTSVNEFDIQLPPGVDKQEYHKYGFFEVTDGLKTGYYFPSKEGFTQKSNFIIKPFFHINSLEDNKRILEIDNGISNQVIEMPSGAMVSLDQFCKTVFEQGNYLFFGTKVHLMKILSKISNSFPMCYELRTLGWQSKGFWAWYNSMLDIENNLVHFDEMGIADYNKERFFSPAASKVYQGLMEEDEYENDRYIKFIEPKINFEEWTSLMEKVYPGKAIAAVGFVVIGLFKDVVFQLDNNCPLLSCYGQKQSGKSKFAESISAFFFNQMPPFNLNHGTAFAFSRYLEQFRNCVVWMDEFDDNAIDEERFQTIKSIFDGAGRQRGKGGSKRKTETQKYNSAVVLTGQYLSTRDDNSALSRCILVPFDGQSNRNRPKEQVEAYRHLKEDLEQKGLTGLVRELIPFRTEFKNKYSRIFADVFSETRDYLSSSKTNFLERVLRNYCVLSACLKFVGNRFTLPWRNDEIDQWIRSEVARVSSLIQESDSLGEFWNIVENLAEKGQITEEWHYKFIPDASSIKVTDGKKGYKQIDFESKRDLLVVRLNDIHSEYLESYRRKWGKTGMNKQSLSQYLENSAGYLGVIKSTRWKKGEGVTKNTSGLVFDTTIQQTELKDIQIAQKWDPRLENVGMNEPDSEYPMDSKVSPKNWPNGNGQVF